MARSKKTLTEKVQEQYKEFADEAERLSIDQLNAKLVSLAKYQNENEEAKERDEDLEKAQALAAELGAPYKDTKKAIALKSKYVIHLLKEKGAK